MAGKVSECCAGQSESGICGATSALRFPTEGATGVFVFLSKTFENASTLSQARSGADPSSWVQQRTSERLYFSPPSFNDPSAMDKFLRAWRQDALNRGQHDAAIYIGDKVLALSSMVEEVTYAMSTDSPQIMMQTLSGWPRFILETTTLLVPLDYFLAKT